MINLEKSKIDFYIHFYSRANFHLKELSELYLHFSELNTDLFYCPYRLERAEALAIIIEITQDNILRYYRKNSAQMFTIN